MVLCGSPLFRRIQFWTGHACKGSFVCFYCQCWYLLDHVCLKATMMLAFSQRSKQIFSQPEIWSRTQCISVCLSAGPGYFLFLVLVPNFTVIEPLICICRCFCRSNPLAKSDCLWQLKRQAEHALIGCHIPHKVHLAAFAEGASQRSLCPRYDVCYHDKQVSVCSDKSVILKSATLQHQEPIAMFCMLSTALQAAISSQWMQRRGQGKQSLPASVSAALAKV